MPLLLWPLSFHCWKALLMAWHLIHYKYVKLDKQTLASLPLKPTCLYILMGAAAIIWMNWLSEMVHLPNIAENVFAQMKNNVFGILSVCIIAPIFEEIFFRECIEGYLLRKWGESPLGHPCVSPYLRIDTHESGTDTFRLSVRYYLGRALLPYRQPASKHHSSLYQ